MPNFVWICIFNFCLGNTVLQIQFCTVPKLHWTQTALQSVWRFTCLNNIEVTIVRSSVQWGTTIKRQSNIWVCCNPCTQQRVSYRQPTFCTCTCRRQDCAHVSNKEYAYWRHQTTVYSCWVFGSRGWLVGWLVGRVIRWVGRWLGGWVIRWVFLCWTVLTVLCSDVQWCPSITLQLNVWIRIATKQRINHSKVLFGSVATITRYAQYKSQP